MVVVCCLWLFWIARSTYLVDPLLVHLAGLLLQLQLALLLASGLLSLLQLGLVLLSHLAIAFGNDPVVRCVGVSGFVMN